MKNVLLLVHDDPGQEARLQTALDVTRALGGHLTCLDVAAIPVVSGDLYAMSVESEIFGDETARESENRSRLQARLAHEDVSWSWIDVSGTIANELNEASKTADLIVVNRRLDSATLPDMRSIAGQVVIGSGKTVIAVPEDARGFKAAGRVVIAWDGSDEAMKAVQAAVPLLALASSVTILEVEDGSIEIPAEEAAAYLSRHGILPEVYRRPKGVPPVGDAIMAEAQSSDADYVVMGGFGHSRIVEALTGGVTREMLTESPIPVVLTH